MIEQFKRRFNSLYWHQFALTAGMVLLTLLLLGVSFFTLSYGTTTADKRGEMRTRAELIAQVSADYFAAAGDASIDEGTALRKLADMASRMTDVDFLICSAQGNVLLTTDEELVGRSITIPQDIVDNILGEKALYQGRSNINGTYSVKKFAVAVPVVGENSQLLGIVLAVMDETCSMDVQMVKGVKNMIFGGEGLFDTVITGPGKVHLQTMRCRFSNSFSSVCMRVLTAACVSPRSSIRTARSFNEA